MSACTLCGLLSVCTVYFHADHATKTSAVKLETRGITHTHASLLLPDSPHTYVIRGMTGIVTRLVERPLCDREVGVSFHGRVIPKILKMVLAALPLGAQH